MKSNTKQKSLAHISLFSGSGIGDLGFRAAGFELRVGCEIDKDRCLLMQSNFPKAECLSLDIKSYTQDIANKIRDKKVDPFIISITAPCQGMSKNGMGTLLKGIKAGKRPAFDERNSLVIPALTIVSLFKPKWVVFENVLEMRNTIILDDNDNPVLITDKIRRDLGSEYFGNFYEVEFADYGIPQRRKRLIGVFSSDTVVKEYFELGLPLIPAPTHLQKGINGNKWVSVSEAIKHFPKLDSSTKEQAEDRNIPLHRVPLLKGPKYSWVANTPRGSSAFDNQCADPKCGFQENPEHKSIKGKDGVNQSCKTTPLFCVKCGAELPRPFTVEKDGTKRIMSGFTSAYKRMDPDQPAPTLTKNLSYACSDQKVHPTQNRVLSLAEALVIQSIDRYKYKWEYLKNNSQVFASDSLIRDVIGESVPPLFFEKLGDYILELSNDPKSVVASRGFLQIK